MQEPDKPSVLKVLYITGFARSGTTILGNILGEVDSFFHAGELDRLWLRAARNPSAMCGCKSPLAECEFWTKVLSLVRDSTGLEGVGSRKDSMTLLEFCKQATRLSNKALGSRAVRAKISVKTTTRATKDYAALMERLLLSIAEVSGARVIIDSSKRPIAGGIMRLMPAIAPSFLHIVRDSRGAILSRQRKKATKFSGQFRLSSVTTVADCIRWLRENLVSEIIVRRDGQHLFLRYEDLMEDPPAIIRDILLSLDENPGYLPVENHIARIGSNHTVGGNRSRFETGDVRLRLDDRWTKTLRSQDFFLISLITSPLLLRYGYSVTSRRSS